MKIITTDEVVLTNIALLDERSVIGKNKYGTELTRDDLSLQQWFTHALEECLDKANYLQAILHHIKELVKKYPNDADLGHEIKIRFR